MKLTWSILMNRGTNKFAKMRWIRKKFGSNFMSFGTLDN
jgi:hypothetical protein